MSPADAALIPPRPAPATAGSADARAMIEGQMAMLTQLAQAGMEIAQACRRDAVALTAHAEPEAAATPAAQTAPRHHPALLFARVARAVRLTIALQSRLAKDLAELDKQDDRAEWTRQYDRRQRMRGLVREAAHVLITTRRQAEGASLDWSEVKLERDALSDAAYERLTEAEDGYLTGRPFDEVVARICHDLGMTPDRTARLLETVQPPAQAPAPPPDPHTEPDPEPQRFTCVWLDSAEPPHPPP